MIKKPYKFSSLTVRHFLLIPVLLLLLYSAYLSFRWALADVLAEQVWHQLDKSQIAGHELKAQQWQLARNWLEDSLELHRNYSGNLELAEFFFYSAGNQPNELQEELGWKDTHEQALNYTRSTLKIKPTWPFLWNDLVLIKVKLHQFDSELTGAIERAVNLGRWEKSVQYDVALTGLDHWDSLENGAQRWVTVAMNKILVMQKNPKQLAKYFFAHPNIGKLCIRANEITENDLARLNQYCKKTQEG